MTDDLVRLLREAGHDAEAASLERKLADGLESQTTAGDANEQVLTSQCERLSSVPLDADEDQQVAALQEALDRDIPGWRG